MATPIHIPLSAYGEFLTRPRPGTARASLPPLRHWGVVVPADRLHPWPEIAPLEGPVAPNLGDTLSLGARLTVRALQKPPILSFDEVSFCPQGILGLYFAPWGLSKLQPEGESMMKLSIHLFLGLAFLAVAGTSPALAICEPITPSISCSSIPCLLITQTGWTITWTDQSGCGCDEIQIWADACDGNWALLHTVDCDKTSHSVCLSAGVGHRLKVVYRSGGHQSVQDIVSSCLSCP